MKIQVIEIENFKGIKRLAVALDDVNFIDGPNGAGKSSVIQAIASAIIGSKKRAAEWLRKGDSHGYASLTLDNGDVISLTNKGGTERLTVELSEAGRRNKPQQYCDELMGCIPFFDPLALSESDPKEQLAIVSNLFPDGYLGTKRQIEDEVKKLEDDRRLAGRLVREFAQLVPVKKADIVDPDDIDKVTKQINSANSEKHEYHQQVNAIKEMESQLSKLKEKVAQYKPVDIDALIQKRDQLQMQMNQYNQWKHFEEHEKKRLEHVEKHEKLESDLKAKRSELSAHIKTANIPIEGFSWSDDGIRVDGKLFSSLSSAEKIIAATKILSKINSRIPLIMIERGNDLSNDSLRKLIEYAINNELQVLIELKGKSPINKNTIHIVDGEQVDEDRLNLALSDEKLSIESIEDLLEGDL